MRTHSRDGKAASGRPQDGRGNVPGGHRRWWRPRRPARGPARPTPGAGAGGGQGTAGAVQLAVGLLTASIDSPELEAWAVRALIPEDLAALADLLVGLHRVSQLLLHELHQATGQHPAATLQRLAILAEGGPQLPSGG